MRSVILNAYSIKSFNLIPNEMYKVFLSIFCSGDAESRARHLSDLLSQTHRITF